MKYASMILTLALIALISAPARATSVIRIEPQELFAKSDLVVTGEVTAMESKNNPGGMSTIVTDVSVKVESKIKGECPDTIVVRVPGGRIGELGLKVMGAPEFAAGDKVLLALENDSDGRYHVRGFHQGRFSLIAQDGKDPLAVQDPWRRIVTNFVECGKTAADCLKDAPVKFTIPEIRKLSGIVQ